MKQNMKNILVKHLFMLPFWAISLIAYAQSPQSAQKIGSYEEEKAIFHIVEQMPEFPGGYLEYFKFLKKNIKYPKAAQEKNIQGWVGVQFIVNKEGDIVNPTIIKKLDPSLDAEALRVIKMMPKWKPGKRNGRAVNVLIERMVIFGSELEERINELENPSIAVVMRDEFNIPYEYIEADPNEVFDICEENPEFPGGMQECMKFLGRNIKFPSITQCMEPAAKVLVSFVVTKEGNVVDPVVLKGVDPKLDAEAIRVIKMMPKWKPGKHRGKAVHTTYTLPVIFRIQ